MFGDEEPDIFSIHDAITERALDHIVGDDDEETMAVHQAATLMFGALMVIYQNTDDEQAREVAREVMEAVQPDDEDEQGEFDGQHD